MINYLMVFLIAIVVFLVKTVIDLYGLLSLLRKDKKLLSEPNDKEKDYELIKGLH